MHNVIVTGGSRGLGLAIAARLAKGGYCAIAIARTETAELQSEVAAITEMAAIENSLGGSLHFRRFDLTAIGEMAPFISGLRKEFGPIYGLVNNAGLGTGGVLATMPDRQIEQLVQMNTVSPIILTKYVLRSMMVERSGRIVNISSIVGSTGYSGLSAYSATKASLLGFTRSLAREVGQLGITVNAIAPGFADTEMTRELTEGQREQIMRRSAMRRLIGVDDVAGAAEYLLSDQAKNITGITLTIDAGNTA